MRVQKSVYAPALTFGVSRRPTESGDNQVEPSAAPVTSSKKKEPLRDRLWRAALTPYFKLFEIVTKPFKGPFF
ncbi:MAG TPA: hypothetical protein V6C52_08225 [Coleofasciculaceae cyanobacterium]|jgi:hypothetical protein